MTETQTPAAPRVDASQSLAGRLLLPNLGGVAALALLPVVLVAGAPPAAWLLGSGMWLLNRLGHAVTLHMVEGLPRTMAVGAAGLGMMLRVWTIALVLFLVAADLGSGNVHIGADRPDVAVPAMLLFMVVLTVDIGTRSIVELRRYKATAPEYPAPKDGE